MSQLQANLCFLRTFLIIVFFLNLCLFWDEETKLLELELKLKISHI